MSDFTSIVERGCSFDLFLLVKVVNLNGISWYSNLVMGGPQNKILLRAPVQPGAALNILLIYTGLLSYSFGRLVPLLSLGGWRVWYLSPLINLDITLSQFTNWVWGTFDWNKCKSLGSIYIYIYIYIYMCVCVYVYICVCIYMCVCVCVNIQTHTHTHTHTLGSIFLVYNCNETHLLFNGLWGN